MSTIENMVVDHGRELIFKGKECKIDRPPLDIYDVQGPLLFLDFSLADPEGNIGWLRFMPDAMASTAGPIVSAQSGRHPYFSQIEIDSAMKTLGTDINFTKLKNNIYGFTATTINSRYGQTLLSKEILNNYAFGNREERKLFCYHYPSIGFLSSVNNELVYIDIQDGKEFMLTESGRDHSVNEETRKPYSLLSLISESGHPGEFDAPTNSYEIQGIELIPQEKDNWCAAASCQMILNHFGVHISQSEIATEMGIPANAQNGGASLQAQVAVYQKYLPAHNITSDLTPLGTECISQLVQNRPLKNGIYQHAQVVYGWEKVGSRIFFKILDPLPVKEGERKHQNPFIIYSMNFIYI